jgi:hypothetical protein
MARRPGGCSPKTINWRQRLDPLRILLQTSPHCFSWYLIQVSKKSRTASRPLTSCVGSESARPNSIRPSVLLYPRLLTTVGCCSTTLSLFSFCTHHPNPKRTVNHRRRSQASAPSRCQHSLRPAPLGAWFASLLPRLSSLRSDPNAVLARHALGKTTITNPPFDVKHGPGVLITSPYPIKLLAHAVQTAESTLLTNSTPAPPQQHRKGLAVTDRIGLRAHLLPRHFHHGSHRRQKVRLRSCIRGHRVSGCNHVGPCACAII